MAEFPAMPLWTDAYLADTGHLTTLEHGAYVLLLMTMWRAGGHLPNDDQKLARYCRMSAPAWRKVKQNIMLFFTVEEETICQKRLLKEMEYVRRRSLAQSERARSKYLKNQGTGYAGADCGQSSGSAPTPTPTPTLSSLSETSSDDAPKVAKRATYSEAFEGFWSAYPRTANMSKAEAFSAWRTLSSEDREKCHLAVPAYIAFLKSKPDLETIHACRFISKRRFDAFAEERAISADEGTWRKRLSFGRRERKWATKEWGPAPGRERSGVPERLIESEDGIGWEEFDVDA